MKLSLAVMFYVNSFNTLDVTYVAKTTNTIYNVNVWGSETKFLELQANFTLRLTIYIKISGH